MLKKITTSALTACLLLLAAAVATPSPQEQKARTTKDQKEFELATATRNSAQSGDFAAALKALKEWEAYHPESDYKDDWPNTYLQLYVQLQDHENTIAAAKRLLEKDPKNFTAHYYSMRAANALGDKAPEGLAVEAAGNTLEALKSQAGLNDEQKQALEVEARDTQARSYAASGDLAKAEQSYRALVQLRPNAAAYSYQLGDMLRQQGVAANKADNRQKFEELYAAAIYSLTRALAIEGEGALAAGSRGQIEDFVKKRYEEFTGSTEDMDRVMELAKANPLPPAGYTLKSITARDEERLAAEEAFRKANPFLAQYMTLKDSLLGEQGDTIWGSLKASLTPEMAGYVVGMDSARPQVLSISSKPDGETEVVLNLENRLRAAPGRGSKIKYEGVASNLTKDPFKLTLTSGKLL